MNTEIKIAHISDLHFDSEMTWPPQDPNQRWAARLLALKDDLVDQKPNVLMVTGDIADNPSWELVEGSLMTAWRNALDYLMDLCQTLFPGENQYTDRLFVIPGNHDAKVLGNASREELHHLTENRLFKIVRGCLAAVIKHLLKKHELGSQYEQIAPIFNSKMYEALQSIPSDSKRFRVIFAPYMRSRPIPDLKMVVFCIDSNYPEDSLLNFAQGLVSPAQAQALRKDAGAFRLTYPELRHAYKLVLLHHHPMPIPLAEGLGARIEGDEFNLLRNAGSFMRECIHNEIDFILHGHQHAQASSIVAFPDAILPDRKGHSVVVIGAGSVQHPRNERCSYNIIRQLTTGEWTVEVRNRVDRREGIARYELDRKVSLASAEQHRTRIHEAANFDIQVGRLDIFASIDQFGNLRTNFSATRVTPVSKDRLDKYPVFFSNESQRATLVAKGFKDENTKPNVLEGTISLDPPATADDPKDIRWEIEGLGLYTFSEEYCRWYKRTNREQFAFGIGKSYDELYIDLEFPSELPPLGPRPEAIRLVNPVAKLDEEHPVHELLATGEAEIDEVETSVCWRGFRLSPSNTHLSLLIRQPLPGVIYRLVWELPADEYEVLPEDDPDSAIKKLRSRTRGTIKAFHSRLHTLHIGAPDYRLVHQFLAKCAGKISEILELQEPIRVDLGVIDSAGTIKVVAAVQGTQPNYNDSALHPESKLGESLRGKAYLQRDIRCYTPGIPESEKDPNRDQMEKMTRHQIAFPLVYPPQLPYFPRIGVLTLSSELDVSRCFNLIQQKPEISWTIHSALEEELFELAKELGLTFPSE